MLAEHQATAAARAIEVIRARGGVLLADAVGMGKSYVAAAVAKTLGCEVELIVPAGLVRQWRETLDEFAVAASIATHDAIPPFRLDTAGRERLVIVDEAHEFRNPRTLRYDALARRTASARVLLVTATPLCNSSRDLHSLLQLFVRDDVLIDRRVASIDAAFEAGDRSMIEKILSELMIRRERDVLPETLQFGTLERLVVRHELPRVCIDDLRFPLVDAAPLLRRFLLRRLESSEAALIESVRRQRRFYERVIESGRPLAKRDYRRAFGCEEDGGSFQQILFWDLWSPAGEIDGEAIRAEMTRLDAVAAEAMRSPQEKRSILRKLVARERAPTIVFTGAAATARDLAKHLGCGLATARAGRDAVEAFRRGRIGLLVTTDFASEGLNLQRAGVIVHYDIPWNPVRLDQRNGRAHRIGQVREGVRAIYFLPAGDETRILKTIARKDRMRHALLAQHGRIVRCPAAAALGGEAADVRSPTLRARLSAGCGAEPLAAWLQSVGIDVPEAVERRHRAGIERLISDAVSSGDRARLEAVLAIVLRER